MEKNNQNEFEATLKYYEIIRNALIARVGFRDNSLMLYLGGVAAIMAAAIPNHNYTYLMIIPVLTLGISGIVTHHHYIIGAHSLYCASEIGKSLKKLGIETLQWDLSNIGPDHPDIRLRYIADASYILLPSLFAFYLNGDKLLNFNDAFVIFGIICFIPSVWLIYSSFKKRMRIHSKIKMIRKEIAQ